MGWIIHNFNERGMGGSIMHQWVYIFKSYTLVVVWCLKGVCDILMKRLTREKN